MIYMAESMMTFYGLSDEEYRKVVDAIKPVEKNNKRDVYIIVDEVRKVHGNPPRYSTLTLSVRTEGSGYSQLEKDTAINIMKALPNLLDFK